MTPRQMAAAVDLFAIAVIASVAIALAGLSWRIASLMEDRSPKPQPATPILPRAGEADVAPILALAPFGNGTSGAAQPTRLPIELRGVILAIPRERSTALIAPSGGTPIAYRVGEPIPQGATIQTIGVDSVILGVGGHRELLAFPKPGAAAAPASVTAPAGPAPLSLPPRAGAAPGAPSSPTALLDSLGATPVNGGYRVGDSLSPAVRQAGLLPGDLIDQVNGTLLGNPAMDQQTLAAAARSGTVRIDLVRGGRRTTITVPLH